MSFDKNGKVFMREFEFDANQIRRIAELLTLKSLCLRHHTTLNMNFGQSGATFTFFGAMATAIDGILLIQINDEVVRCMHERGATNWLVHAVLNEIRAGGGLVPTLAIDDMHPLLYERTNFMIQSYFLNFMVETYSVFELFMDKIYECIQVEKPRQENRKRRVGKLIEKFNAAPLENRGEVLDCIINSGGNYVSGRDKINIVMSSLPNSYPRDLKRDREVIDFYASVRNTVHNLGRSKYTKDLRISVDGNEITLLSGRGMQVSDWRSVFKLCEELVDIYFSVCVENIRFGLDAFILVNDRFNVN